MSRPSRVRAMALGALLAAAGCQDYNFNPVGHCLIAPGSERVTLSDVTTADVLFVVDDSGSMRGVQQKLADNFGSFIQILNDSNTARVQQGLEPIDFHLAITTTSVFYDDQTGALCRSDCPGGGGENLCCLMTGSTPTQPLLAVQTCTGAGGACDAGECRQDCQGWLGDWVCCDPTTKSAAPTQPISCATVGQACGNLRTHYQWNPANPGCVAGHAVNGTRYPQGAFVGVPANPLVLHFDKSLYECATPPCSGTTNLQGYTAQQLMDFFRANITVGTCGSGQEQGLEAGKLAVQKALAGEQLDTREPDGSTPTSAAAAWPQDKSKVVLVFVGDEDDCSSPQSASEGLVMSSSDPGADACTADKALPAAQQKEFPVSSLVDWFRTNIPGDHPLGAAFIVSAVSAASNSSCEDDTCVPDVCCDTACTGNVNVCTTDVCGGKAGGTRFLEAAGELRAANADVVSGSICDDFATILARIGEIVKPPTGLLLPSQPADEVVSVLRIAAKGGKTRKTCRGPAPSALDAAGAKAAGWDWWFTASREQVTDLQQQPTVASRYVYINHDTQNCEASGGETYSMDYIARLPAVGCSGATAQEADDACVAVLGGRPGDWTCFDGTDSNDYCTTPTGGGVVGTCICGPRLVQPLPTDHCRPAAGNCPWGCAEDSAECPARPHDDCP